MTNVRAALLHVTKGVFVVVMAVTYASLAAGLFGLMTARAVSLIAIIGAGVGVCATLAFAFLSDQDRRSRLPMSG
jgi:hypothetical protein